MEGGLCQACAVASDKTVASFPAALATLGGSARDAAYPSLQPNPPENPPLALGDRGSASIDAQVFSKTLDWLASEYHRLELENEKLRAQYINAPSIMYTEAMQYSNDSAPFAVGALQAANYSAPLDVIGRSSPMLEDKVGVLQSPSLSPESTKEEAGPFHAFQPGKTASNGSQATISARNAEATTSLPTVQENPFRSKLSKADGTDACEHVETYQTDAKDTRDMVSVSEDTMGTSVSQETLKSARTTTRTSKPRRSIIKGKARGGRRSSIKDEVMKEMMMAQAATEDAFMTQRTKILLGEEKVGYSALTEMGTGWTSYASEEDMPVFKIRSCIRGILLSFEFDLAVGFITLADCIIVGMLAQERVSPFLDNTNAINIISYCINVVYLLELCMRFFVYGVCHALKMSTWVKFDFILVSLSIVEFVLATISFSGKDYLALMGIMRILRTVRLTRSAKVMIQFRTLWLMMSGLKASLSTVLWTLLLTGTITYLFAITAMETIASPFPGLNESVDDDFQRLALANFGDLSSAMLTLMQTLTLDSIAAIYRPLIMGTNSRFSFFVAAFFISYIFLVSIALMNLVTAVMVEGSFKQAKEDQDALQIIEEMRQKMVIPKLQRVFQGLDEDNSGVITWDEVERAPWDVQQELREITKTDDLKEIFELLDDDDSGKIEIDEFLHGVYKAARNENRDILLSLQMGRLVKQVRGLKRRFDYQFGYQESGTRASRSEFMQNVANRCTTQATGGFNSRWTRTTNFGPKSPSAVVQPTSKAPSTLFSTGSIRWTTHSNSNK